MASPPARPATRALAVLLRSGLLLLGALLLLFVALGAAEAVRAPSPARGVALALLAVEGVLGAFALALLASLAPREPLARRMPADSPRVALLLPVANEDPDVLAATLAGVNRMTWAAREAWVLDDTRDPHRAAALRAVAEAAGAAYRHRADARGWKAGALNDALREVDAPYVIVLDVDHVPEPDMAERLLERFVDGQTAFVQGKLAWRNATSPFRRLSALLQTQFYEVVQREKEKRGTVVFAGSGACFRRDLLLAAGGFPEDTLVEDFDVTLAILARGGRGRFADAVVARGVLPWTAADQVRQLWRWSAGTTRILRLRAGAFAAAPVPRAVRIELLLDAAAYLAAGLIPLAGALLLAGAFVGVPVGPSGAALALMVPALLLLAHAGGAAVSLRRAGDRPAAGGILAYHIVSLAFTPVLLLSSLWGLLGGVGTHGRVAKVPAGARGAGRGTLAAAAATFALGCALLLASALHLADGRLSAVWAGELGVAFLLPLAFLLAGGTPAPGRPAKAL